MPVYVMVSQFCIAYAYRCGYLSGSAMQPAVFSEATASLRAY